MPRSVTRGALIVALFVGSSLLATSVGHAGQIGMLKQFNTPIKDSNPSQITQGSDGNMWVTESRPILSEGAVARVTPHGETTDFVVCDSVCVPRDIAQGPDSILYFTNHDTLLGRITTDGEVLPGIGPDSPLQAEPRLAIDGDTVWVTDPSVRNTLWRFDTTTNVLTPIGLPSGFRLVSPADVAVDRNGVVWIVSFMSIISYDPVAGVFTATPLPADGISGARSLAVAADGSIWYARTDDFRIGRLDPVTREIIEFPVGNLDRPREIAAAPDGSLWFTQNVLSDLPNIAQISPTGQVVAESKPIRKSRPAGIAVAANGDPWYADQLASEVVTLRLG